MGVALRSLLALLISRYVSVQAEVVCNMDTVFPNQKGPQTKWEGDKDPSTAEECKQFCLSDTECKASELRGGNRCVIYHMQPDLSDESGTTHWRKTCAEVTTQPPTTTTPPTTTHPPTTTPPVCQMTSKDYSPELKEAIVSIEFIERNCPILCCYLEDCKAVTYSDDTCSLYNTISPITDNPSEVEGFIKTYCDDNPKEACRMDPKKLMMAVSFAIFRVQANELSCQTLCLRYSDCTSVYFIGKTCHIYTQAPTSSRGTAGKYFLKECSPGAPVPSVSLTKGCRGKADMVHTSGLMIILMLFANWFLKY